MTDEGADGAGQPPIIDWVVAERVARWVSGANSDPAPATGPRRCSGTSTN